MKSSQEDINVLNVYLKGRLSSEETNVLKERLALEMDLYADLQDLKVIQEGLRVSVLKDKMDLLRNIETEPLIESNMSGASVVHSALNKKRRYWLGLLLLLIIGAMMWWFYQKQTRGSVSQEYAIIFAERFDDELILHKTMRAAVQTDELNQAQRRAYEMYSIQLFDDAIPLLDDLWISQKDTLALFYLGVSHLGIGEKEKGLLILNKPELTKYSKQTNLFINH